MERLTEIEMGDRQDDGTYPPGSVNERVASRLERFAEERAEYQMANNGRDRTLA